MTPLSFLPTRRSLVDKLAERGDQRRWNEFFQTYHRLIFNTARRAGLSEDEAQETVQETLITVSRNIGKLRYDPAVGSFKGWLLNIARWRIVDQFRRRDPKLVDLPQTGGTAAIERLPQTGGLDLDTVWDQEWREQLFRSALETVKQRIEPRHYQIFDCYVLKDWPAQKVASELRVNLAQVYLIRHRVRGLLKAEIKKLDH